MNTQCMESLNQLYDYLVNQKRQVDQGVYNNSPMFNGTYYSGFEYGVDEFKKQTKYLLYRCDSSVRFELEETANWLLDALLRDWIPQSRGYGTDTTAGYWYMGLSAFCHYMWSVVDKVRHNNVDLLRDVAKIRHWIINNALMANSAVSYESKMIIKNNHEYDGEYDGVFVKLVDGKVSAKVYRYMYYAFRKEPVLWGEFIVDDGFISGHVNNIFFF